MTTKHPSAKVSYDLGTDKPSYKIKTLNKISSDGLSLFELDRYEIGSEIQNPDAIVLRSCKMLDMDLPDTLLAVGRAGIGVNNIPIEKCTERGVVVMNTPGANANAVKELAILGLLLSSRKILEGLEFSQSLKGKGTEIPNIIEEQKKNYGGQEIAGKQLGVIGLGKIGVMLANSALDLGMNVVGYDPFISVEAAWGLSRDVEREEGLDRLVAKSDYISIHTPLTDETRGLIDMEKFQRMKKGVRLLNFSRGGIVNNDDLKKAIETGVVAGYVTDFPDDDLINSKNVICIPHLGASTREAESNCAQMMARQMKDFLENGNIINSVNFPTCSLERTSSYRLLIANRNIPNMVGQISTILAREDINIVEMLNKSRDEIAYNIIDISSHASKAIIQAMAKTKGVVTVRLLLHE